jgi:hypothetical protein
VPKKASFTLGPVLALLLLAAAVLVGAYTFLLSFAERTAAESIQDRLGLENKPGVEFEGASPANVLAGEVSGGTSRSRTRSSGACGPRVPP